MTLYLREEEIRHEALAQGRAEGKAEGLAEGKAEGKAEGIFIQTAKYYRMGRISLDEALSDTGLSKKEFLELANTNN